MIRAELRPAYHWSPLELKIENIGMAKLIKTVLTIGTHWIPLEFIGVGEYRHGQADSHGDYHLSPLESIVVADL